MTITLDIPADIARLAEAEALRKSLVLHDYLLRVVAEAVSQVQDTERISRSLAPLDSLDDFEDAEEHKRTFESLREAIHQDRTSERRLFA